MFWLHESKGDPLEKEEVKNQSLRYAAYQQFIWWIYQRFGEKRKQKGSSILCFVEGVSYEQALTWSIF